MKRKTVSLVLVLVLIISCFAGCGGAASPNDSTADESELAQGSIVLKFASVCGGEGRHPWYEPATVFEKAVEERSGGIIDVQIYTDSQLGNERELYESMMMGNTEMMYGGSMVLGNFTKKVKFWGLPFFFSQGREACMEFFDIYGQKIQDGVYEDTGIYCIWTDNGAFQPANIVREIKTPDDMKDLKFRCHEIDTFIKGYESLGAVAVPMAFSEIYTALQQGTITGTHTNNILLESNKFYESCKYYAANMNLVYDMGVTSISGPWYDALPEDLQKIVWEEAENFRDNFNQSLIDWETGVDERLQNEFGVTYTILTPEELQVFIDKAQTVYEWFRETGEEPDFEEYYNAAKEINERIAAEK